MIRRFFPADGMNRVRYWMFLTAWNYVWLGMALIAGKHLSAGFFAVAMLGSFMSSRNAFNDLLAHEESRRYPSL